MKQAAPKQKVLTPPQPARQNSPVKKPQKPFFSPVSEKPALAVGAAENSFDGKPVLTMGAANDSFEREANTLAERAVRIPLCKPSPFSVTQKTKRAAAEKENKPINRDIHSHVTAVINTPGQPLEDGVRRQMESFFHDNFTRVRVHDDRQAHESAAEIHARAYSYGNHMVFSANAYQPNSLPGKKLIAHELTHIVQQAGGEKLIQRDPDISIADTKEVTEAFSKSPELETILVVHKKANPTLASFADKLLRNYQNNIQGVFEQYIEKLASDKTVSSPADSEMDLLFDIYKKFGNNKEAAKLAKEKKYLPQKTAFYSAGFYKEVLKDDLAWLPESPSLKKYFPGAFVDTYQMYLYGPFIKVQSLDIETLRKKQAEMLSVIQAGSGLVENERTYIAIESFALLDKSRLTGMAQANAKIKPEDALSGKMVIAKNISELNTKGADKKTYQEFGLLLDLVVPKIRKTGRDAHAFWKKIIDVSIGIQKNEYALASERAQFAKHKDLFNDFERLIVKAAKTYLELTWEGGIPTAPDYSKQRKDAAGQISLLIKNASLDLIRLKRNGTGEISYLYGILILYMEDAYNLLLPATGKDNTNHQIITRLSFGIVMGNLGILLSSAALSEISHEVNKPTGKRIFGGIQKESFLAFRDPLNWERGDLPASQSLKKYMEENTKISYSSSMAALLDYFFVNASMQEEITQLKGTKELQNDSKMIEVDLMTATRDNYVPIPTRIRKLMDEMSRSEESFIPRRFVLHGAYFSAAPADQTNFSQLIFKNERLNQELDQKFGTKGMIIAPVDVQTHLDAGGLVVWVISQKSLKEFAAAMINLFPDISIPFNVDDQPIEWWSAFLAMVKDAESGKGLLPNLKGIQSRTTKSLKETQTLLNFWRRKALSYHRRVMERLVILPLWNDYKEDTSHISSWENPAKAIDQMIYLAGAHPYILDDHGNEELKMQIAAAMLETGPVIYDKLLNQGFFGGAATSRLTIVSKLLPHVAGAVSLEKEVTNDRKNLLIQYPPEEHAERVERLRKLQSGLTDLLRAIYKSQVEDFVKYEDGQIKIDKHDVGDWLQGKKDTNELRDLNSTEAFNQKTNIRSEGNTYTLLQVLKDFNYQPAVEIEAGGVKWDKDLLGDINPSVLFVKDSQGTHPVARKDRKGEILFTYLVVDKDGNASDPIPVRDTDDVTLKEIYSLIYVYSTNVNLGTLVEVLETGAEWLKLPLYFVPGLGEAVMAADLVVGVLQFITSPEFQTLKSLLLEGDGKELIAKSFDLASSFFSKEKLFDKLLDENFEIPKFATPEPKTKKDDEITKHSDGRLMKFVNAIVNFGKKLWNGVSWLKSTINFGLKELHTFILNRPFLAAVISAVTNNWHLLEMAVAGGKSLLGLDDEGGEKVEDASPFSHLIESLPEQLGELQVPLNLVPLDALVDLIVRMALKVLKGPKGIIAGSVKKILEEAGIYQKILNLVANKMSDTKLDPNKYINEFINSKIQPIVQDAGNYFVEEIGGVFGKIPELKKVPVPNNPTIGAFKDSGESVEDEPETQSYPGPSFNLSAPLLLPAHPTNGKPLNKSHQQELEEKYDQDFSHVRLHDDVEAGRATSEVGAEALATGSHVYLRNGLSPDTDTGNKILKHELAHVVQQTGSRPASVNHSDKPVDGKPGKGIVFDSGKEAEANAFANGGMSSGQLTGSHSGDRGQGAIHPLWSNMSLKFFKAVSKEPEGPSAAEKTVQSSMGARLTDAEKILEKHIPDDINSAFSKLDKLTLHKRLGTDKELFIKYLKGQSGLHEADFGNILRLSKVKKSAGKDKDEKTWQVDEKRFSVALKEFIAIKTGIMTDFHLKIEGNTIDLSAVSINDVYLDKVRRGTNIWNSVILNTFTSPTRSARVATKFTNTPNNLSLYSDAARKVILASKYERVFAAEGFRLSDQIAKTTEDMTNPDTTDLVTGASIDDPIPIYWYKNTTKDYPQKIRLTRPENKDYPMDSGMAVTLLKAKIGVQIGVDPKWMIKASQGNPKEGHTVFQRNSTDRGSSKVNHYRETLKELGYDMQAKGMDVDHVTDLAFGGPDEYNNLWPLDKRINRIAYDDKWYKRYQVEYKVGNGNNAQREITTLFDARGKWFAIKGYSDKPERPGGRWTKK